MNYKLTHKAKKDIVKIAKHTLIKHGYQQVLGYENMLLNEFQNITDIPTLGNQRYIPTKHAKNGMRKIIAGEKKSQRKYYICYCYNPKIDNIYIISIIHISRDLQKVLNALPVKEYQEYTKEIKPVTETEKPLSPYEKRKLAEQQKKGNNKSRGR